MLGFSTTENEADFWIVDFADGSAIRGCRLEPDLFECRAFHSDGRLGPSFQAATRYRAEALARRYLGVNYQ